MLELFVVLAVLVCIQSVSFLYISLVSCKVSQRW